MHLSGPTLDSGLIEILGLVLAILALLLLRRSAKLAISVFIAVVCFVPIWVGVGLGFNGNFYLPAASGVACIAIVAVFPVRGFRLSLIDCLVILLIVVGLASLLATSPGIALSFLFTLLTYFVVGYVIGRFIGYRVDLRWIYGAIAVAFTIVAVLAIIEYLAVWNPFVLIKVANSSYATWGSLQIRGGLIRSEGAFGHSIALGSSLALAVPLALASRFRIWIRALMVLLMLIATVVTFSRIGMVGALLGLVLSILFMRDHLSRAARVVLTASILIVSAVLFPFIVTVFTDAGAEASGSAAYRGDLVSLLGSMNLVGVASSATKNSMGQVYFGNYLSIDSQLILTGLSSGLLALGAIVVALAVAVILVVRRKASAATIAVVAQIPAFATVALITQYAIFAWFVIGLAVTSQLISKGHEYTLIGRDEAAPEREEESPREIEPAGATLE